MQKELNIQYIPTIKQVCMLCHFSSECGGCCKKCIDPCNAGQVCGLEEPVENHSDRFAAWVSLVKNNQHFRKLRKFIP